MEDKLAWYEVKDCSRISMLLAFSTLTCLFVHQALQAPLPLNEKAIRKIGCEEDGYFCEHFSLGPRNIYQTYISGIGSEFKGVTVFFSFVPKSEVLVSDDRFSQSIQGNLIVERLVSGMVERIVRNEDFSVELVCSKQRDSEASCNDFTLTTLSSLQAEEYRITLQLRKNDILLSRLKAVTLRSELESLESGRKLRTHQWMIFLLSAAFFFAVVVSRTSRCFNRDDRHYQIAVVPLALAVCGVNYPYFVDSDQNDGEKCPDYFTFVSALILPMLAFTLGCFILVEPIRSTFRSRDSFVMKKICCKQEQFGFHNFIASLLTALLVVDSCHQMYFFFHLMDERRRFGQLCEYRMRDKHERLSGFSGYSMAAIVFFSISIISQAIGKWRAAGRFVKHLALQMLMVVAYGFVEHVHKDNIIAFDIAHHRRLQAQSFVSIVAGTIIIFLLPAAATRDYLPVAR